MSEENLEKPVECENDFLHELCNKILVAMSANTIAMTGVKGKEGVDVASKLEKLDNCLVEMNKLIKRRKAIITK